ncbi:MAG: saccharopine dehydrogenase NADP-binding domain-containing protein [Gammaproteobacteria bacterium]|nr:saccharopine dehydrogenase NADP-binding domain-containing protein [Gammaproteobacteria bacterium]MBU0889853.1 saccharopine dehydrogenase NADP-binding domain-containing protein [Gammaproteobacteria bacterium]
MSSLLPSIAVYGATGHTGQFVVQQALLRGINVVAVGRSAGRLEALFSPAVVRRVADLGDARALEQAFRGCGLVVNCVGPFLDSAPPVAQAALRAGCHYIDVTAEQPSAIASFAELHAPALAAGRVVIPAAGFYGGLADLLATALAAPGPIDEITVAMGLDRWWPTAGTRLTGERNKAQRLVVQGGRLVPLAPSPELPDWTFASPLGTYSMVELPFSEMITLAHHLPARNIRSLINQSALADIRDASTPPPTAVDDNGRSAQRFEIVVRLVQNGETRIAGVRGQDIYAVTAPVVIDAAQRLLAPTFQRSGALSLGEAVPAREVLRALHGQALEVFGDVPLHAAR